METKYTFEAGLSVFPSFKTIVSLSSLSEWSKHDNHDYHIYALMLHDKYYFEPLQTKVTKEGIEISLFKIEAQEKVEYKLPLWKNEFFESHDLTIDIPYPYTWMKIIGRSKEAVASSRKSIRSINISADSLYQKVASQFETTQQYEVVYVGKAYGKNGKRTAFHRLVGHETLQKIMIDIERTNPNKQLYVLLLEYASNLMMKFDGMSDCFVDSQAVSDTHFNDVICHLPAEEQVINITEAALIHYFKPKYNLNYVENFPNKNHKGYRQYFDLDYNTLTVELDLEFDEPMWIQLFTKENRIDTPYDYIQYKLFNDNNRLGMYEIFK